MAHTARLTRPACRPIEDPIIRGQKATRQQETHSLLRDNATSHGAVDTNDATTDPAAGCRCAIIESA